ncbi:MAG TPA: magnesium transporter [Actinomycetota bacterium]|jgi:mgtE-like transporter|nr:magnesium transporter [Actinomycetota bacterium]
MRRGIGRVFAYWRAERRTIGQGFVALVISSLGSLIAGVALGSITGTLERLPGLMVMVPAAIGMRGNIFGALGSRLGTSIHSGMYAPTREREGILYQNVYAVTVLTFAISLLEGALAKTLTVAFGVRSIGMLDFVVIAIVGAILSSLVVGAFTVALSRGAYRRGWDLDSVAGPLITAAGDMVTVPAMFLATFLIGLAWVTPAIAGAALVVTLALTVRGLTTDLEITRRILRESLPILAVAGTVDILAGLMVEARLNRFLLLPALFVLIPPYLEGEGALGAILSSRLASKLHLGAIAPRLVPESLAWLDASIVIMFSLVNSVLTGVAAHFAAHVVGLDSPGLLDMIGITLVAGLIATVPVVVVAYYTAVATFRLGLDPDNHGIPMITSSMDFVGVISLIIALLALGVGS